jgi:hypothetical protein
VVEDNKPKEEPGIFIGKKTEPGWKYFEGLGFSVRQD